MAFNKKQQKGYISSALEELRRKAKKERVRQKKGFEEFRSGLSIGSSVDKGRRGNVDSAGYENENFDGMQQREQENQEFPEDTFGNAFSTGVWSAVNSYKRRKLKIKLLKTRTKLITLKVLSAKSKTDAAFERGAFILMIAGAVVLDVIQIILLLAALPSAGVTILINILVSLFISIPLVYLPSTYIRMNNVKKIKRRIEARGTSNVVVRSLKRKIAMMGINSLIDVIVYLIELIPVLKVLPLYTISKIREFGSAEILRMLWGKDTKGEIAKLEKQIRKIKIKLSKIQ